MRQAIAPAWQHPYMSVFKLCQIEHVEDMDARGDVTEHMDRIIGKKVFKVRGIIPAGNYVKIPKSKSQSLGLTGRFLYIQMKATPIKVFVIHIEVVTEDLNVHRISVSQMYGQDSIRKRSFGIQIPFSKASHRWCVVAVDLEASLRGFTSSPFHSLKSVQLCSWLTVRSMYTSDMKFTLANLPRDMALSHALDSGVFEMVWLPKEPKDVVDVELIPVRRNTGDRALASATDKSRQKRTTDSSILDQEEQPCPPPPSSPRTAGQPAPHFLNEPVPSLEPPQPKTDGSQDPDTYRPHRMMHPTHHSNHPPHHPPHLGSYAWIPPRPSGPPENGVLSPPKTVSPGRSASARSLSATTDRSPRKSVGLSSASPPKRSGGKISRRKAAAAPNPPPPGMRIMTDTLDAMRDVDRVKAMNAVGYADVDVDKGVVLAERGRGPLGAVIPAMHLHQVNSFTGEFTRVLKWPPNSSELVFAAASVLVAMPAATRDSTPGEAPVHVQRQQRFFLGHTSHVCALTFDAAGAIMASGQEGKQAIVRVWDFKTGQCAAILNEHASGLSCLDLSPDGRALVGVGLDNHSRQLIVVWNIDPLRHGGKVTVLARHATEFNIKCIRFSEFEEDHLVSCGRDSIRFYRLKGGQLRGMSVRLTTPDRRVTSFAGGVSAMHGPNIFTDVAFESGMGMLNPESRHIYVSSAAGSVFEVSYGARTLSCIYQLHSAAINAIVVHDGFCITGSDDKQLRVWPMDFSDYLLEAEHEAAVTSVGSSQDGLRVCVGTENGALGVLDIPSHQYETLLRSHVGAVNAVAADPNRNEYCTASSDGTIRVWSLDTHVQLFEFHAPGEVVTCVAYHPSHYEVAAGYQNGRVRVFDITSTTLVQEHKQHRADVLEVLYSMDGACLFSSGSDGGLCVYDVASIYQPIKFLSAGAPDVKVCMALSRNGRYLATVSRDQYHRITSLVVFHTDTLEPYMRIDTDVLAFTALAFGASGEDLWALAADNRLDRYELREGALLQQVHGCHRLNAHCMVADGNARFVATGGDDQLVKLWAAAPPFDTTRIMPPACQAFVGHPSAVFGAAVKGDHLITVGDAASIFIWSVDLPDIPNPAASHPRSNATSAEAGMSPPGSRQWLPVGPTSSLCNKELDPSSALLTATGLKVLPGFPLSWGPEVHPHVGSTPAGATASPRHASSTHLPSGSPSALPRPHSSPSAYDRTPTRAYDAHSRDSSRVSVQGGHATSPGPLGIDPGGGRGGSRNSVSTSNVRGTGSVDNPAVPRPLGPYPLDLVSSVIGYTPSGIDGQNVVWRSEAALFAYAVDNVLVLEDLATRRQRYHTHHTCPIACVCVSNAAHLMATAAREPESSSQYADICVWQVSDGDKRCCLRFHPQGVQTMAFSPGDAYLVSVGRDPERSLVVWDLATEQVVAVGRTLGPVQSVAWLPDQGASPDPRFVTAGADGLYLWTLTTTCLEQLPIFLGEVAEDEGDGGGGIAAALTAVAVDDGGTIVTASRSGIVFTVSLPEHDPGTASISRVADTCGGYVTQLRVSKETAVIGTATGVVTAFNRMGHSGGVWSRLSELSVDGAVSSLWLDPLMREAVCATTSSTIWFLGLPDKARVPMVCSHQGQISALAGSWGQPDMMVSASLDGVLRVWQMGGHPEPLEEFQSRSNPVVACTAAAIMPRDGTLLAGYSNGSLRMMSIRDVSLMWSCERHTVSSHGSGGSPVVSVHFHPRKPLAITAARNGSIAVTNLTNSSMTVFVDDYVTPTLKAVPASMLAPMDCMAVSHGNAASMCAAAWATHFAVFATPWEESLMRDVAIYRCEASAGALSTDVPAAISFVPGDAKMVVYVSPMLLGKVILFDYRLAAVSRSVVLTQMSRSLAVSPDGTFLAVGGQQGSSFVVEYESGRWVELSGHIRPVSAVQFSGDSGRMVAAAGSSMLTWTGLYEHFLPTTSDFLQSRLL